MQRSSLCVRYSLWFKRVLLQEEFAWGELGRLSACPGPIPMPPMLLPSSTFLH